MKNYGLSFPEFEVGLRSIAEVYRNVLAPRAEELAKGQRFWDQPQPVPDQQHLPSAGGRIMKITKLLHPRIKRVYRLGRDDKDHKPVYIEVPVFGGEFDTLVDALAAAGPIGAAWLPGICPYDTDLKTPDRVWLCQPPFTWIEAPGVAAQYNAWKVEIGDRDRQEFGDEIEGWHEIIAAEDRINHRRYKQSTRDM